jgi:hypothetical protein
MQRELPSSRGPVGIGVLLLLLCATPCHAKDYCVTLLNNPNVEFVGLSFKIPGKGKCNAWHGFEASLSHPNNFPSAGTGCTSSDGSQFNITITTTQPTVGAVIFDSITLALPTQTGTDSETILNDRQFLGGPVKGAVCKRPPI